MTTRQSCQPFAEYTPAYIDRCKDALDSALGGVRAYREWRAYDPGSSESVDARYKRLPTLGKADIRRHTAAGFVPDGKDLAKGLADEEVEYVSTSGTTDEKVTNLWYQDWWDASEVASWKLNARTAAIAPLHREAILTSALCTGFPTDKDPLPFRRRRMGRFLYLNEYWNPELWTPELLDRMVSELARFEPEVLEANPTMLAILSRHCVRRGLSPYRPVCIILTYEYASRLHYRQIRSAFAAPAVSSYGTTETGYVFMECEHGRYHQNTEFCHVDYQPLRDATTDSGRIFVTTLGNPWYRLVRFDVGDLVTLSREPCACGRREGLTLDAIAGRVNGLVTNDGGQPVVPDAIDAAVSAVDGLVHYQVVQSTSGVCEIRYMCDGDAGRCGDLLTKALQPVLGPNREIVAQHEMSIAPDPPGKYRLVKSAGDVDVENLFIPWEDH